MCDLHARIHALPGNVSALEWHLQRGLSHAHKEAPIVCCPVISLCAPELAKGHFINATSELSICLLQYEEGSAPALALKATIERTEKRFKNYADAGLLCGTDGLPHLISDPGLALRYGHTGETLVRAALPCT
jgi:hypothetical protein